MPKRTESASQHVTVNEPVIDYLVFVVPWGSAESPAELDLVEDQEQEAREKLQALSDAARCSVWKAGGRYKLRARLELPSGAQAKFGFCASKPLTQKGGIHVQLNPSKLEDGDVQHLHKFLRQVVGPSFDEHLPNSIVNRMDMAVDIEGVDLDDLLIDYRQAHEATVFGTRTKRGRIETMNFGSVSSDFRTAVYDKRKERVDKALKKLIKQKGKSALLKDNLVRRVVALKSGPSKIRVEIRGVKIRQPVHALKRIGINRFERFVITQLSGLCRLDAFDRRLFLALVQQVGVRAAVAHYEGHELHKRLKEATADAVTWWEPDGLWVRGLKALRASGIFPRQAFKAPKAA